MKALVQQKSGGELQLIDIPKPVPAKGEVLVKIEFAPINPSDLSFLNGSYAEKPEYPAVPGIEASGIVVGYGKGLLPRLRMGKTVSCSKKTGYYGTWAEYFVTDAAKVVPFNSLVNPENAASMLVNPLTAIAFIEIALQGKHKAVFNNAAGGALGKMLVKLCKTHNIKLISSVRSETAMKILLESGAEYIVNTSSPDYETQLADLIHRLTPTLFFDAVGGSEFETICRLAPKNSTIMPYANLSESNSIFNPRTILQRNIRIEGFFLGNYNQKVGLVRVLKNISKVKSLINSDLKSDIHQIVTPEQAISAIEHYRLNMSAGKILIRF